MSEIKYGQQKIMSFCKDKDLEIWPNKHNKLYEINVTLPEFTCLCPRSGYPDFATIYLVYSPNKYVIELKALKLYINSFRDMQISHEDSINEIYDTLYSLLCPHSLKIIGDFKPRGNVHTKIEIDSKIVNQGI
jgi:7-cyano-7-deazaguanine reductase